MLSFICDPCKTAADLPDGNNILFSIELKRIHHDRCAGGTRCDCQHKVGRKNHP